MHAEIQRTFYWIFATNSKLHQQYKSSFSFGWLYGISYLANDWQTNKQKKMTIWLWMSQNYRLISHASRIKNFIHQNISHILHLKDYCKPWAQREFVLQNAILEEDKSLNGFIDTSRKTKNHMRMLLFSQNI